MLTHYTGFQDLNKVKNVSFEIERTRENAGFEVARIKTVFTLLSRVGALMVFKRQRFLYHVFDHHVGKFTIKP